MIKEFRELDDVAGACWENPRLDLTSIINEVIVCTKCGNLVARTYKEKHIDTCNGSHDVRSTTGSSAGANPVQTR